LRTVAKTEEDRGVQSDIWVSYPAGASPGPNLGVNAAVAALVDFSQRGSAATSADVDHVMRSLASHDAWWVPIEYARQTWGQSDFDQTLPFEDKGPLAMLNVFTHPEAAALGEASASGDYGGPVSGVRLLQNLDPGLSSLFVNPGSPREHQWYIETGGFDIAAGWATAVAVERALATWGNGPVPAGDLLGHHYHLLVDTQTHSPAQVFLPEIDGVVAVCFTATDRTAEFVSGLPAAARPFAETSPVEGRALFELVRTMGAAGVVINAGSDDQTALTGEDIAEIVGARR
jgi:hypothetical protein